MESELPAVVLYYQVQQSARQTSRLQEFLCISYKQISIDLSNICNRYYIREDTGCRNTCSGTITFNNHWVFIVPFSSNHYNIITSFQVIKWVTTLDFTQSHLAGSIIIRGNKP